MQLIVGLRNKFQRQWLIHAFKSYKMGVVSVSTAEQLTLLMENALSAPSGDLECISLKTRYIGDIPLQSVKCVYLVWLGIILAWENSFLFSMRSICPSKLKIIIVHGY